MLFFSNQLKNIMVFLDFLKIIQAIFAPSSAQFKKPIWQQTDWRLLFLKKSRKMDQEEAPIIHGLDFQVIILIDSLDMWVNI